MHTENNAQNALVRANGICFCSDTVVVISGTLDPACHVELFQLCLLHAFHSFLETLPALIQGIQHYKLSQICSTDAGYSYVYKYTSLLGTQLLRTGI